MFITKNNFLKGLSPSVTSGLSSDLPSNISSSDHSLNYSSSSTIFRCEFEVNRNVSYVAVSASNLDGASIVAQEKSSGIFASLPTFSRQETVVRNNVLLFIFPEATARNIEITISGGSVAPVINHIAAGQAVQIPNGGELSGYARQWLNRNVMSRTISNSIGAPVTNLTRRQPLKGNLNIPNMTTEFAQGEWQNILDFLATGEVFYISENADFDSEDFEQSYACFQPKFTAPKAHSDTRALQNLSLGFSCYNGL